MAAKVTFDPVTHEINVVDVGGGIIALDFKVDVYSAGKEDWLADSALAKHTFPLRAAGGDSLPGGLVLDAVFFIASPWKMRPVDRDHQLTIVGNVFREDGENIFLSRTGRTILVSLTNTFSAGSSVADIGDAVHGDGRALTVGKFLALK